MRQAAMFSFFGTVFGFVLSRAGATSFDAIAGMFLLTELHLMGVIGVAIVVAGAGFWWLRRQRSDALAGLKPKPMKPGLVFGSALFGVCVRACSRLSFTRRGSHVTDETRSSVGAR